MVPAWFYLTSNRRVSPNTLCSLASTLKTRWVPAWFQLGSSYRLVSSMVPAWFLIAGYAKTHYVCLVLARFKLGSSLVPLGSSSRMQQSTTCLHGSALVPLGSASRGVSEHVMHACIHIANRLFLSLVPAWFHITAWFQVGSSFVPHGSSSRDSQKHTMFVWFLFGSSLVPAWFRLVPPRECNTTQHVCMVPAWFHLTPHHGVLVPTWFR